MTVDPAINFMVLDILRTILSMADKPDQLGQYITTQMRQLAGANTVILLRSNDSAGMESHTLLGISPERRRGSVEFLRATQIADLTRSLHAATIIKHDESAGKIGRVLQETGGDASIIVPLEYGATHVGVLLMINIIDITNIESVIDSLDALSGVLALEIRNAGFYLALEATVEERTRELRENEKRLQTLITQAPIGTSFSRDGITIDANPAYIKMFGYANLAEIRNSPLINQIAPQCREEILSRIHTRAEGTAIESTYETIGLRKDGSQFPFLVSVARMVFSDGPITFSFFTDLTERNNSEMILRDVQRRESLGVMSSGIAHDFNNLLGTMMGNISLAQTRLPSGHPALRNIEKALSAMEHAADLTKQMLAYSGKGKYQTRMVDMAAVVKEHISLFSVSLPKNVKIETHLAQEPVYINGDPGQIEQIVMNMIINGGDAIGDRQGVVSVSVSAVHMTRDELVQYGDLTNIALTEGEYALLSVTDNGSGMSADVRNKIFDPFFTTKFTGRGLGLSAVLGIIRSHEGGLSIESAEGIGTTFRVLFPLLPSPLSASAASNGAAVLPASATTTVLVIDDEEDVATTAQEMLVTGKYSTLIALNPVKGIELYRTRHSDIGVVLLDLTMPEMSGKEVVDALRMIDPDVRIIISSGYTEDDVAKRIQTAAISGFIQKPYRMQTLLALVESVVRTDVSLPSN